MLSRLADRDHTVAEIAAALDITDQDAAQRAGVLEARGYLRRFGTPADIRIRTCGITAAGRAALDADGRREADLQQQVTTRLDPADIAAARRVLAVLTEVAGPTGPPRSVSR